MFKVIAVQCDLMVVFCFLPRVSGFALHFNTLEIILAQHSKMFAPLL